MSASPAVAQGAAPGSAFVLGATGYVGGALVRELRARGHATTAHLRHDSPRRDAHIAAFRALGADVDTTPWEAQAFRRTFDASRPSLVFLCLGTTLRRRLRRPTSSVAENYTAVDVGLTALVVDALVAAQSRARVVLVSAAGANPSSRSAYLRARGQVEQHLIRSGLEHTIARPGIITGPDRAQFRPFERTAAVFVDFALLFGAVLGMQMLRERHRSITATELAKALIVHGGDPKAANRVLHGERLRDFP